MHSAGSSGERRPLLGIRPTDENELCLYCLQKLGNIVSNNFIQCDSCHSWFHESCVPPYIACRTRYCPNPCCERSNISNGKYDGVADALTDAMLAWYESAEAKCYEVSTMAALRRFFTGRDGRDTTYGALMQIGEVNQGRVSRLLKPWVSVEQFRRAVAGSAVIAVVEVMTVFGKLSETNASQQLGVLPGDTMTSLKQSLTGILTNPDNTQFLSQIYAWRRALLKKDSPFANNAIGASNSMATIAAQITDELLTQLQVQSQQQAHAAAPAPTPATAAPHMSVSLGDAGGLSPVFSQTKLGQLIADLFNGHLEDQINHYDAVAGNGRFGHLRDGSRGEKILRILGAIVIGSSPLALFLPVNHVWGDAGIEPPSGSLPPIVPTEPTPRHAQNLYHYMADSDITSKGAIAISVFWVLIALIFVIGLLFKKWPFYGITCSCKLSSCKPSCCK